MKFITKYKSENYDIRVGEIKFIILHYTAMKSLDETIKHLCEPSSKVSCHYLINRKGTIFRLVKDKNIAWHAGNSMWERYKNLNKNSIGIELVNKGHKYGYQAFTKIQIKKLVNLCKKLKRKYKIKNRLILGHSDIAPLRKIDPGEKFPCDYLSSKGVGIYPANVKKIKLFERNKDVGVFFKNLSKIGYRYLSRKFQRRIVKNFQRRFRQKKVDGVLDLETLKISEILAKKSNIA